LPLRLICRFFAAAAGFFAAFRGYYAHCHFRHAACYFAYAAFDAITRFSPSSIISFRRHFHASFFITPSLSVFAEAFATLLPFSPQALPF